MRVCVAIRSLANGGAEKQALALAAALQDEHETSLVILSETPRFPRHEAFLAEHEIDAVFLPRGLGKLRAFRRFLAERRVERLFCFLPSDTLLGAIAGRLAGVERIYGGLRNTHVAPHKARVLQFLHNRVLDGTISNSHAAARAFARRGFRADRMLVVSNGIAVRELLARERAEDELTVLTVARFVPQKDHGTGLRAFASLVRRAPTGVRYRIVGHGPGEPDVRRRIRELGLERRVEVVRDPADVDRLYADADVYLCSSRDEGLSNAVMEAMNHGLPVVATDVGDNGRLVEDGVNGRLVAAGDAEGLAGALLELVGYPWRRRAMGRASHARLAESYSLEAFREAYRAILAA